MRISGKKVPVHVSFKSYYLRRTDVGHFIPLPETYKEFLKYFRRRSGITKNPVGNVIFRERSGI